MVLVMDADSILDERFVEEACKLLVAEPQIGAVSAAYIGKKKPGFLPMMQRIEYAHERRRVARRKARVSCLSGTAALFTMGALRHLLRERGKAVPGRAEKPEAYLSVSLTEDFEITLALRTIGYRPLSTKQCISHTDVMPTVSMLWSQRLRWQRGTLETLRLYGLGKLTWRLYLTQIYTYAMSLATPLMITLWVISVFALHSGLQFSWWILLLLPLSAIEQFIATFRLREWKATSDGHHDPDPVDVRQPEGDHLLARAVQVAAGAPNSSGTRGPRCSTSSHASSRTWSPSRGSTTSDGC